MVIFKRIIYDFFPQKNLRKRVINYKADLHIYKILNSKYRQLIKKKKQNNTFVQWLFVNCQVCCVPLENYLVLKKKLLWCQAKSWHTIQLSSCAQRTCLLNTVTLNGGALGRTLQIHPARPARAETGLPVWDDSICLGQPSIQQAFQIRTRTKHFGINTMYSLFSQIYKIYISSFVFSFSFIYIELIV